MLKSPSAADPKALMPCPDRMRSDSLASCICSFGVSSCRSRLGIQAWDCTQTSFQPYCSSRSSRKSRKRFTKRAAPNENASSAFASTFSSPISNRVSSSCPFSVFSLVSSNALRSARQKRGGVGSGRSLPRASLHVPLGPPVRCLKPCCGTSALPLRHKYSKHPWAVNPRSFQRTLSQHDAIRIAEISVSTAPQGSSMRPSVSALRSQCPHLLRS